MAAFISVLVSHHSALKVLKVNGWFALSDTTAAMHDVDVV